ncbi:type III-B CRISPR-associated protein Cas10/Cmr2 [Skermanella sp. TT6]|uniref:Type III-B CRISPR-associated protein Cas10/Cmr2 n=1 Tax=Skermanella cutis TaxID=2775420 RepID=A0ABX7BGJ1_9PROT|nr:type III-B CRISPR-associated protein Cas10/Cmr2 [Skermanella sp. TT6]QQP92191.1 type III-B CRISPR-associated protein Cas10/Cmr2 [Skermanella sp. TT6]
MGRHHALGSWLTALGRSGRADVGTGDAGDHFHLHPFGGARRRHPDPASAGRLIAEEADRIRTAVGRSSDGAAGGKDMFLSLWRHLPEAVAAAGNPDVLWVAADDTYPTHTVWQEADLAARRAAMEAGGEHSALLSVVLGPVQSMIAAARSLRDLWTGSTLLSWLAFRAMEPVLVRHGPTALIFPVLRGNPLMDRWLGVPEAAGAAMVAGLPHRFLASIPWGGDGAEAVELARECEAAARAALREMADLVRQVIDAKIGGDFPGWDRRWDRQIDAMLDIRAVVVPDTADDDRLARLLGAAGQQDLWPGRQAIRQLLAALPEEACKSLREGEASAWQARVELVGRVLEAARSVRPVQAGGGEEAAGSRHPAKCTLLGTWERMGPDDRDGNEAFWRAVAEKVRIDGVRLRRGERFCAPSLVKRFVMPAGLARRLGIDRPSMRFPDTATVAAREWLGRTELPWQDGSAGWSGQWLHRRRPVADPGDGDDDDLVPPAIWQQIKAERDRPDNPVPTYYAVVLMDGDNMGDWLSGRKAPALGEILPAFLCDGLDDEARKALEIRSPVGPQWQAALSEALAGFSGHIAPHVVKDEAGTLVYAGGDDVLAFLPARRALACAKRLRDAFGGALTDGNAARHEGWFRLPDDRCDRLTLGPRASLSAGIVLAHHKEDLRAVLAAARQAEKAAKSAGRNRLALTVLRRSGERAQAVARWADAGWIGELVDAFVGGASDRWAYRLRRLESTLSPLPPEAVEAEIRRQVDRSDTDTRRLLGNGDAEGAGRRIAGHYAAYREGPHRPGAFRDFVLLCQSAGFIARGRDA